MTPAIYHKIVAVGAFEWFHDYCVRSTISEGGLLLTNGPVPGIFTGHNYRETALGAGRREIVRSTGTLLGRNTQS